MSTRFISALLLACCVPFVVAQGVQNSPGVTQLIAGSGISLSPSNGQGAVTITNTGGGGGGGITALTGDVTASGTGSIAATTVGLNGTLLSGLSTGLLKNTTSTGVPTIATAGRDYAYAYRLTFYTWCFGNSFMAGAGGTSFSGNSSPNSWCNYLANGSNLSYNNGTPQTLNANQGISGYVTPEIANKLVNTFWQNPNLPVAVLMDGGANDGVWNQTQYAQVLLAMFHHAVIPQSNRIFASAATQSGTWTTTSTTSNITPASVIVSPSNASLPSPGTGMTNSVSGSTLTFAIPSSSTSTHVTLTYFVTNSATSTFGVSIDGVPQIDQGSGTTTFSSLPVGGVVSVARSTLNNTIAAQEFTVAAGAHSLVVTNTSNAPIQILDVDWNPPTNTTLVNPVFFLNANTNYSNFSQNNATAFGVIAQENANGLPVFPVDQINGIGATSGSSYAGGTVFTPGAAGAPGINTTSDMATSATSSCPASAQTNHPNDCGNVKLVNLVRAVMAANNYFVSPFTSVPYNYTLSQTNVWTAGNTFNAAVTFGTNDGIIMAGGNISGVGNVTGTGILALGVETVTFSATPTFSATKSLSRITLTGNVTSSTLPIIGSFGDGVQHCFDIAQNGTGSNTFVWPTNVIGASTVSPIANSHTAQCFTANVVSGNYYAVSAVGGATGTAGGDLSGTYPNPTVAQVNGAVVPTSANVVSTNGSNQLTAATAINGLPLGTTTPAAVYAMLSGSFGDLTGTPSIYDAMVTSTNAAGTITSPSSHALSTSGILVGAACTISRLPASTGGGQYDGIASCPFNTGGFLFYSSTGHALGSEAWSLVLTLGTGGAVFTGNVQTNFYFKPGTVYAGAATTVAAATTIAPTSSFVTITGASTTISTMTPPAGINGAAGFVDFIAVNIQTISTTGGTGNGQFATPLSVAALTPVHCAYGLNSTTLWYCH